MNEPIDDKRVFGVKSSKKMEKRGEEAEDEMEIVEGRVSELS